MPYLQLSFQIHETEFAEIEALLSHLDALSITAMDAADCPILEPAPGETPLWHDLILTALFLTNKNKQEIVKQLAAYLDSARLKALKWKILPEQDWERAWLKDYQPLTFGQKLWVGPQSFITPADIQAHLFLDPGLAFGTGSHPTTFLCLEWLVSHNLQNQTVLDFGCGSGILALAALKLGAHAVIGLDIDPQALEASRDNAARNQIDLAHFKLYQPDALPINTTVDILLANVLANPLIELSATLLTYLRPQGILVLSGILTEQAEAVMAAYRPVIDWLDVKTEQDWVRLVGQYRI